MTVRQGIYQCNFSLVSVDGRLGISDESSCWKFLPIHSYLSDRQPDKAWDPIDRAGGMLHVQVIWLPRASCRRRVVIRPACSTLSITTTLICPISMHKRCGCWAFHRANVWEVYSRILCRTKCQVTRSSRTLTGKGSSRLADWCEVTTRRHATILSGRDSRVMLT